MKKMTWLILFFSIAELSAAQKFSFRLQAFERLHISGVAPGPVIEIGGKEVSPQSSSPVTEYLIYLITKDARSVQLSNVWIKNRLYPAGVTKLSCKPVVLTNGFPKDTLATTANERVWQIRVTGKAKNAIPAKNIASLLKKNELVLTLHDKQGRYYTGTASHFTKLEPERDQ